MADQTPKLLKELQERAKILCIHGYRQNGQAFREKTGSLRKALKKHADFVYITAPNVVPQEVNSTEATDMSADQRAWWFSREDDYFKGTHVSDVAKGFDESLQVIEKAIQEQGPFDGVLGFSQGASMVSLLCGLQQQDPEKPFRFKFAILVAGFKSRSTKHSHCYDQPISLPTLHVFGDTDGVIPKDMSEELVTHFSDVTTLTHPGGHFVPASGPQKPVYHQFLAKMATL